MNPDVLYRCSACGHEEMDFARRSCCPQCLVNGPWNPKEGTTGAGAPLFSTAEKTGDTSRQSQPDDFPRQDQSERDQSIDPGNVEFDEPACSTPPKIDLSSEAPFRLFVKKVPRPSNATSICLEVLVANRSGELLSGQLWLADEEGRDGQPTPFSVPQPEFTGSNQLKSQIAYPQIRIENGSSGKVAVRIRPTGYAEAFWQAEDISRHESNGTISVNIDKSVRADKALGGISKDVIYINGNQPLDKVNWHELGLRLRGPKGLAVASDASRPVSARVRHRPVKCKGEFEESPSIEAARLTLSTTLEDGREAYVQLIAGKTLHLGRARTWLQVEHQENIPNDVVLRGLSNSEYDDYISRYHGRIRFAADDIYYENLSGGGSEVGNRSLNKKGDEFVLRDNSVLRPGKAVATDKESSLGLVIRRTRCVTNAQWYQLLAKDAHLESGMEEVKTHDVVTLYRTDLVGELEHYIFFQQAAHIGSHSMACGWRINHPSVQPIHATILWFDESFWIEPCTAECVVKVDGIPVPLNRVRRLKHSVTLDIAGCRYLILPDWKQHVIDCHCCQGHGYEEGCQCQPCIRDHEKRQKQKSRF